MVGNFGTHIKYYMYTSTYGMVQTSEYARKAKAENKLKREKYTAKIAEYLGVKGNKDLEPYIRTRKTQTTKAERKADDTTTANGYIRWDALCELFNAHFIPKNEKDSKPAFTMTCCQLINEDLPINTSKPRAGKHISPVLMSKLFNPLEDKTILGQAGALDNSLDPTVCLFPGQDVEALDSPRSKRLSAKFSSNGILPPTGDPKLGEEVEAMLNYNLTDHEKKYYIGHIYFNIQRLQQTYQSMKYEEDGAIKEEFYMYDYVKKIWDNVNEACGGNHDFKITTDFERPNLVRVVDMRYQENNNLKQEDIIELNIQSNDSIVRDFAYNTSIPSAMSSTIAIAAQAPKNVDSLEAASFGAFHKNISNRFASFITPKTPTKPTEEEKQTMAAEFDENMKTYTTGLTSLAKHMDDIVLGNFLIIGDGGDSVRSEEIGKHKGLVSAVKRAADDLIQMYPQDSGDHYKGEVIAEIASKPTSAIIPLKFTATLDGMGGIVIGNVFKIPSSRLPKGYKDANIAFVVMGEEQTITSGQDWTTKITGQMIMLPVKPKEGTKGTDGWDGMDYNLFDEDAPTTNLYVANSSERINMEEQGTIDRGMDKVRVGHKLYLKMNSDRTHVRQTYSINNEERALDYYDNVIGLFPKRKKGLYLGTVIDTMRTLIFARVEGETIKKDKWYRANPDGSPNLNEPVSKSEINNEGWPWYKIQFGKNAQDKFKPGAIYIPKSDKVREKGADYGHLWKTSKTGWMRMDVLMSHNEGTKYGPGGSREQEDK